MMESKSNTELLKALETDGYVALPQFFRRRGVNGTAF